MDPDHLFGATFLAMAMSEIGLLHDDGLSPDERQAQRQEADERRIAAIAEQRASSPHVAAAEAKRQRRSAKRAALTQQTGSHAEQGVRK